jgi:hypothetical protein
MLHIAYGLQCCSSRCVAMMMVSERIESCGESTSVRRAISEHPDAVEISKIRTPPFAGHPCCCDRHLIMLDTSDHKRRLTMFASLRCYEVSDCPVSCLNGYTPEHILTD